LIFIIIIRTPYGTLNKFNCISIKNEKRTKITLLSAIIITTINIEFLLNFQMIK